MLINIKSIVVYLILVLFLIDLSRADTYNKIARIIKILLFPLLFVFNIHYKKINVGLLFAALLINFISFYILLPGYDLGTIFNFSIFETTKTLIGLLKFVVIAGVMLSWFYAFGMNFYNSATTLIQEVYETTVSVFRNIIPPTAGFDLSPLLAFFAFQLAERMLEILMFEYFS
tara:strand:- start:123 stop:641 length:519 start_codon:yes stop_codon:yes gene_type:complete